MSTSENIVLYGSQLTVRLHTVHCSATKSVSHLVHKVAGIVHIGITWKFSSFRTFTFLNYIHIVRFEGMGRNPNTRVSLQTLLTVTHSPVLRLICVRSLFSFPHLLPASPRLSPPRLFCISEQVCKNLPCFFFHLPAANLLLSHAQCVPT